MVKFSVKTAQKNNLIILIHQKPYNVYHFNYYIRRLIIYVFYQLFRKLNTDFIIEYFEKIFMYSYILVRINLPLFSTIVPSNITF